MISQRYNRHFLAIAVRARHVLNLQIKGRDHDGE